MMKNKKFLMMGFLLLLLIAAAGCSPSQQGLEPETEVPGETEQATVPPTELPTATAELEKATEEPEETELPDESGTEDGIASEDTSACVECHTDQAMLIDTADPVEEVESENEGSG